MSEKNKGKKKKNSLSDKMKNEISSVDEEIDFENESDDYGNNDEFYEDDDLIDDDENNFEDDDVVVHNNRNDNCEKEIQICFFTNIENEKYKIDSSTYTVPVTFKRIDLSRMVKKLLDIEDNVSFEFLINKKILRTTIEEFIRDHNILSENVIEIEYSISLRKRESKNIDKICEWIFELITIDNKLYCSTFDGTLLYYDMLNFKKIYEKKVIDNMPVYSYNIYKSKKLHNELIYNESVVGLTNGSIKVFLNEEKEKEIITRNELYLGNHIDMIKCISFNKDYSMLLSAGNDNKINIFDNNYIINELLNDLTNEHNTNKRKKKSVVFPKKCIHNDSGMITSLKFFDNIKFLSTGLDKNIKIYDLTSSYVSCSYSYNKSIICSDILNNDLFITADEHSMIKLFDVRNTNEKPVLSLNENKYHMHDKIITSLKTNKNEIYFLSSSHDGYTNIYDIRLNNLPVYTFQSDEKSKILSSTWFYNDEHNCVVNAEENNLILHIF
ncbi:microtubule-associated protein ytm1 homologue, putative [Plasmodium reichenowi]|uniref:Microtubule-associated protein ytm1 homologue, putative n=1 Tax=Plasmodium reichenowi TaxID=5854 RepID=A0A151LPR5_PLARE|nr:microtubule-associated protein ytm1-like protein [Plasmodium reichenowi]KYO01184.1 microtubule-associated protein ytm1-like protein [Plasmodium reichenowi]SOV77644.1 microtubule-associated protein ytm1 homologue, putative [Plasmodium reichenowi]